MTRCNWCGAPHNVLPSNAQPIEGRCAWCGSTKPKDTRMSRVTELVGQGFFARGKALRLLEMPELTDEVGSCVVYTSSGGPG